MNFTKQIRPFIRPLVGSVMIGVVVFVLLLSLAPNAIPFSQSNYGWNGMQQVLSSYHAISVTNLAGAEPGRGQVLLVVAPTLNFSQTDSTDALNFVIGGGTLVVSDSSGVANSLLSGMGSNLFIQGDQVKDPLYNWRSPTLPIALITQGSSGKYGFLSGVRAVALDKPSSLTVSSTKASSIDVVGVSSPESAAYSFTTGSPSLEETGTPLPMLAVERFGQGVLIVLGDSAFFTNSNWKIANNQELIDNLLANSTVYLDTSHWPKYVGDSLRAEFLSTYSALGTTYYRYAFATGVVAVSILILPVFSSGLESERRPQGAKDTTSGFHTRDIEILNRIRKDREKYGVRGE